MYPKTFDFVCIKFNSIIAKILHGKYLNFDFHVHPHCNHRHSCEMNAIKLFVDQ